jgi:hypothetical protein
MSMIPGGMRTAFTGQSVIVLIFAPPLAVCRSNSPGG